MNPNFCYSSDKLDHILWKRVNTPDLHLGFYIVLCEFGKKSVLKHFLAQFQILVFQTGLKNIQSATPSRFPTASSTWNFSEERSKVFCTLLVTVLLTEAERVKVHRTTPLTVLATALVIAFFDVGNRYVTFDKSTFNFLGERYGSTLTLTLRQHNFWRKGNR